MNKTKNKHRALNKTDRNGGFFKALLFGLVVCIVVWLLLSLAFAFVMSGQTDSTALLGVLSPVVVAVSLFAGGFAAGKNDKSCAFLSSFVLGCVVLFLCYGLSSAFCLSKQLSGVMKTFAVVGMLIIPVIGAWVSVRHPKKKGYNRKRL